MKTHDMYILELQKQWHRKVANIVEALIYLDLKVAENIEGAQQL